jgi:Ca2+-binding EF-hand superfamily protein
MFSYLRVIALKIIPCRLHKARKLRALFERMDLNRNGSLSLDEFEEYMARENPRSKFKASVLFEGMRKQVAGSENFAAPTITFLEVLTSS